MENGSETYFTAKLKSYEFENKNLKKHSCEISNDRCKYL